jgi:hypothetical protein
MHDEQLGGTILESQGGARYKKGKTTKMIQKCKKRSRKTRGAISCLYAS